MAIVGDDESVKLELESVLDRVCWLWRSADLP